MYVIVNYDTFQKCNEVFDDFTSSLAYWEENHDINSVIEFHNSETNSVEVVWDKTYFEYDNIVKTCEVIQ